MKLLLPIAIVAALAAPAHAQVNHADMDHGEMDHAQMDHGQMDHGEMDHGEMDHGDHDHDHGVSEADTAAPMTGQLRLADQPELVAALAAGGTPVVASVLGAVCDFCSVAMNKTFGKRDEVAAVYVDLDDKTLNLVLKPGMSMDDETLTKVVKKAGYKVAVIDRAPALPGT